MDAADGGGGFLLERCERLLRVLLRRRRQALPHAQRNALASIARSFETASATVQAHRTDAALLAWILAAMYWRGCRHPAALLCPPLHPPTRLLGWLTRFSVRQQVDQSAAVLALLPAQVARIQQRSHFVVAALLRRAPAGRVVLLPELLEPTRQPARTAIAEAKSSVSQRSSFARQTAWQGQ